MSDSLNLLDYSVAELKEILKSRFNAKCYAARQVVKWIHQEQVVDFNLMTNLSKNLRDQLSQACVLNMPKIVKEEISMDGTIKWLLELSGQNFIETVFIPETKRGTLCISSQVGCILNCSFCATGKQGFSRNLTGAEIIGQVWQAQARLKVLASTMDMPFCHEITNVVFMGMGEPLLNYEAVLNTIKILLDDDAYGLSKRRVTVSTAGVVPKIYDLANDSNCALMVSLHAPNDELRNQLVPLNKKYPLAVLLEACHYYLIRRPNEKITMEYVMLQGVNDSVLHAKQLVRLLANMPVKINLIPFHRFKGTNYVVSSFAAMQEFKWWLMRAGMITTIRTTRGDDINGACGQLKGKVTDRTKRQERFYAKEGLSCN